jgi:hypothetical protein
VSLAANLNAFELSRYLLWGDSLMTFSSSPALRSLLLDQIVMIHTEKMGSGLHDSNPEPLTFAMGQSRR